MARRRCKTDDLFDGILILDRTTAIGRLLGRRVSPAEEIAMNALKDLAQWWDSLEFWMQLVLGVGLVTWLPTGFASSSVIFGFAAHCKPENMLRHYWGNVFGFWTGVFCGYVTLLFVGWCFNSPYAEYHGMKIPGKATKNYARERLAVLATA